MESQLRVAGQGTISLPFNFMSKSSYGVAILAVTLYLTLAYFWSCHYEG
jgi:hypothetical protein